MSAFQSFYDSGPNGFWIFLLISVVMGAGTSYISGRAVAATWRPFWHAVWYALVLGLAVRFIHFALYQEVMLSAKNYTIDCAILLVATAAGFRMTRNRQMHDQYGVLSGADAEKEPNPAPRHGLVG